MDIILPFASILIIVFSTVNLFRMAIFLIGADLYNLKKHLSRSKKPTHYPTVSVIIPAYNENKSIISTIASIEHCDYPNEKIQIIVVNDGSTDATEESVKKYIFSHKLLNAIIVNQPNLGKANALNNGIKNYATGQLIMCLDADSYIARDSLSKAIIYFEDKRVKAVASNVKVAKSKGLLNSIQRFEYIICYQLKKAQTYYNIEYIVGGIGSIFRKSFLEKINFYDANTVTEDIDITMKILRNGNKNNHVVYASDVIAYTQGALTISDLIRQRYRWKWGRYQTFLKNKDLFFSGNKNHTKGLSWFYLPYALYSDVAFFFEPLLVFYIIYLIVFYHDFVTLFSAVCVISVYLALSVLGEESIEAKDKTLLVLFTPIMYFLFYILSFVEYFALAKSWINLHYLKKSIEQNRAHWKPIKRKGISPSVAVS